MKRNLAFVWRLVVLKIQHTMSYRLSFFGGSMVDGSMFLLTLAAFEAIYSHTDSIGGWNRGQMIIFIGTFSMLNAINMVVYFFGVLQIPEKIATGRLDEYVTKPVSALLRLTFEQVNLGSILLIPLSVAIILYGVHVSGAAPTAGQAALYIAFLLVMAVVYYDVEVALRTIPFFVISAAGIEQFEGAALDMCMRVPGTLYHGALKALFYLVIPYGILSTVPTQVLTGEAGAGLVVYSLAVAALFTAATMAFWRFGLRHYRSSGS